MISHNLPQDNTCTNCGYVMNATTSVSENREQESPKEGDLSVCAGCGMISKFNQDCNLRPVTPEELVELHATDEDAYFLLMKVSKCLKSNDLNTVKP